MAICPDVKSYLDKKKIPYETVSHPQVFSCIEEAKALGIDAGDIVKNLVIKIKDKHVFVLLPGSLRLDVHKLREIFGKRARLELEEEMPQDFPKYEVGAVPPFGELFGFPVYADKRLLAHETIIFTGGTHTDSIKMQLQDFINLVKPEIVDLAEDL